MWITESKLGTAWLVCWYCYWICTRVGINLQIFADRNVLGRSALLPFLLQHTAMLTLQVLY